jgi:hypothetical protein
VSGVDDRLRKEAAVGGVEKRDLIESGEILPDSERVVSGGRGPETGKKRGAGNGERRLT